MVKTNVAKVFEKIENVLETPVALPATLDEVLAYQNENVVARISSEQNLTRAQAEDVFMDAKRFLYMAALYPAQGFIPAHMVDQGWHAFLEEKSDYDAFCMKYFGRVVAHNKGLVFGEKVVSSYVAALTTFGNLSDNWAYYTVDGDEVLSPSIDTSVSALEKKGPALEMASGPCGA